MPHDAIPATTDILCESCGYVLNGLPESGNCPECGTPIALSTTSSPRSIPAWETMQGTPAWRFQKTFLAVLRAPKKFFRNLSIHGDLSRARLFGILTLVPIILFNSKTIILHYLIMLQCDAAPAWMGRPWLLMIIPFAVIAAWVGVYLAVVQLTWLEARYWGMRLPKPVVRRALPYVAVHVLLASLLPWMVVMIYLCLLMVNASVTLYLTTYLFVLSGSVVLAAVHVFSIYWRAMRAMLYANR